MGRVLFVEDDPAIRKLVQTALRSLPHELHVATNGREGLEMALRLKPDVIFTDVSMPEMDGLELADAVRAHPELSGTRLVFVTASVQKEQIERYVTRGASAYIAKPFSPKELREEVLKWIKA